MWTDLFAGVGTSALQELWRRGGVTGLLMAMLFALCLYGIFR